MVIRAVKAGSNPSRGANIYLCKHSLIRESDASRAVDLRRLIRQLSCPLSLVRSSVPYESERLKGQPE
jgi:hypothetical protein